jgi:Uma2 family endonuclease
MIEAFVQDIEKTVSLDELMALGSDARVEVRHGRIVEMSPVGGLHHVVVQNYAYELENYVRHNPIGLVFPDGLIFLMNEKPKKLKNSYVPDVSFVLNEKIPEDWNIQKPFPGVPTLAVEVVSPGDDALEVAEKAQIYLNKGTEQVLVTYPENRQVYQYRQDTPKLAHIYSSDDEVLDLESLLPGFSLPLSAVFRLPPALQKKR